MRPVENPPNPWSATHREWLGEEAPGAAKLQIFEDDSKSFISTNDSPDLKFRHSANPYRGCTHACAYCYARPSHQYLSFGAGTDFESKIVVKRNAAKILRQEFMRPSWQGEPVVLSGNTDCYQPLEASYQITRACLEVFLEFQNPLSIITKSALIRRDIELLQRLNERSQVQVSISVAWADDAMARLMEPGCTLPSQRFEAMRALSAAGIPVIAAVAPIIPGLNDSQIAEILIRAKDAGARGAFRTLLRLPAEVKEIFITALDERFPSHAKKVLSLMRQERGGALYQSEFGKRMSGQGPLWEATDQLFRGMLNRLGMNLLDEESGDFATTQDTKASAVPENSSGSSELKGKLGSGA